MAHIIGNDPHCIDCIHYREKQEGEKCLFDGICDLPNEQMTIFDLLQSS